MLSLVTSVRYEKSSLVTRTYFCQPSLRKGTKKRRLWKILHSPRSGRTVLSAVEQPGTFDFGSAPSNRTCPARTTSAWKWARLTSAAEINEGLQREKRPPDTQHRAELAELPGVALMRRSVRSLMASHPLMLWITEHAAQLKNRYMVGADGKTPCLLLTSCSCQTRRLWRNVRL